ncbi:AAA family ATPase [Bradyrhizobium erythrophlei]|uniref:trifunctional serine/threonine-protein kinase/ATP-binding protein/sensor histidine kinase n=1 Tax=Bradyrhizobium erythrophlei TaxID=1437360 RepID=UPI0035E80B13
MNPSTQFSVFGNSNFQVLWEDGERVFCRGERRADTDLPGVLALLPAVEHPAPAILDRLVHEYELKEDLDRAWAVHPLQLVREGGRTMLVLEDPGGQPLDRHLGRPMELGQFLRLAISLSAALRGLHERGIIHKDIKPANVLYISATEQVWLTGFGIASRLPRERQAPAPPEVIAGTLAYMAPEQTGRMNRSIDARSDLYALGVTFYQMLTGALPFAAADPLEWVYCHIAKRPTPPSERLETVPAQVSEIVLKLLAKTAEERYQTASGLERDLRRCLAEWERQGRIDRFTLGEHDISGRLVIPEKLYGREHEVEILLSAFDRVLKRATPELVLVSGYSGIGKSSVVNELHKVLVPPRGLFSSGKFDQYKRDIPYSTLAQAFQGLIRPLLGKSDAELAGWRAAFQEALAPNGQLMIDLVPELKHIIGDQPPVPELGPQDTQRRFQRVFCRFVGVFAQPEHPLALFLDDLQWLDAATLDLIEYVLTQSDLKYLMLIGAYRDNEVDAAHPLMRKLDVIRQTGAPVQEVQLAPLGYEHLRELTTDALRCTPPRAAPLADLVHEKTAGNPFFVIQFLHTLADEGLLTFDVGAARWSWDLDRLHAKGYTDNVVDLMVRKLVRRPEKTQQVLQQFACLGAVADATTLAIVLGTSRDQVHVALWDALCQELVERRGDSYRFIHDRVQEAAYSMIPETSRAGVHLRIGRLLTEGTPPEQREEAIFEIVSQLNLGAALIPLREEREQVAELNLIAGKRAKASTAYASALSYLNAGGEMLADDRWQRQYPLTFALGLYRAECEFLSGNFDAADILLQDLLLHGSTRTDKAAAYRLKIELHVLRSESPQAVECALECLRLFGIDMCAHPSREQFEVAFAEVLRQLEGRSIESLIDLPRATDPDVETAMQVLSVLYAPAFFTDEMLVDLHLCHMINITLKHGMTEASPHAFAWFGIILGHISGRYADGYRFARLACDAVERHGFVGHRAKTLFSLELVSLWTLPVSSALDHIRAAFAAAVESGDVPIACFACNHTVTDRLLRGDSLDEIWPETERGLAFARRANFRDVVDILVTQQRFIQNMRGRTASFSTFDGDDFDEIRFEEQLTSERMPTMICWYWIMKAQARFMSGDFDLSARFFEKVRPMLWSSPGHVQLVDYHYFSALTLASLADADAGAHRDEIEAHCAQLGRWAESCPGTFSDKYALVRAEIARLDARDVDAMRLYRQAIGSARESGLIQNEAIANELAARFYAARDFDEEAHLYLRNARHCYRQWGADGKVRQLDEMYPYLRNDELASARTSTIRAPVEHLDLVTVIKVSQAVSSEIVLEKLIGTLLRTALEQAGAERGLLILERAGEPRIAAEATASGDTVIVQLRDDAVAEMLLPESVLHYVLRTRESVIIDDAAIQSTFAADPYIRERQARSILCLPLITQAKLIGVLYLENNLSPHVFAPARTAVLKLVASQAAIALENSRLYSDLQEREAKIRRLVDANIIGILIFDLEGQIIEANDAFLRIVGYDREDLALGRMRWTDLTPPEWRDRNAQTVEEVTTTGTAQPYEKEYFRKDGNRVPVLVGAASFEKGGNQGVAFVVDLTERKQAEEALRELASDFAHMNRVSTMGELAASLSHEILHPIATARNNARAGMRFLEMKPPNLDEVREALGCVVRDADRAKDIVGRMRDQIKKVPPRKERFGLNEAIEEVIVMLRGAIAKNRIAVSTYLMDGLVPIRGDRVQLQQVLLNLILNAVEAMISVEDGARDLSIRTEKSETGGILFAVQDSGPGIDPGNLERVFEPFYTTKTSGIGMGLSICRSIINAHGGRLWVAPNEPRGAVFQFTLPAQEDS